MFRRSKSETVISEPTVDKVGGKGRPTPTRKEAEAAAKARAKTPRTRKEQAAAQRATRSGGRSRQLAAFTRVNPEPVSGGVSPAEELTR